jgi:hypothetical protein
MTRLMDNDREGCTYLGDGLQACGCATVAGKSYCEEHLWLVYQKGTAVHRKKDIQRAQAVWDIEACMHEAIDQLIEEGFDLS